MKSVLTKSFIAKLVVKPEKQSDFEALQIELKRLTHAHEPDTFVYELLRALNDPLTYFCVATFKDEQAFQLHQTTEFHDRLVPLILACLAHDMEIQFLESLS
jgi:quinol monooxygenase YgiN